MPTATSATPIQGQFLNHSPRQVFQTDELEALGARMMRLKKAGQEIGAA